MKTLHRHSTMCLAMGLLLAFGLGLTSASAQLQMTAVAAAKAKVARLLQETGLSVATHDNGWTVTTQRKNMGQIRVGIATDGETVSVFTVLAEKAQIRKTFELLNAIARGNDTYDYAKILIDRDGDLQIRIEQRLRLLDTAELQAEIDHVADVCDDLYLKIVNYVTR